MTFWVEIIGYVGMAFILISFTMKDIKVVRAINMVGAILSLIYGILTRTIPTACLNASLFIINSIYMIIYIRNKRKEKQLCA